MQRSNKIYLIFLAILLASCCDYVPSSSEKAAKETTLAEIKALEKDLRALIPDLALQKYPGTQLDYLFFRGNYLGMDSEAEVRYVTNLPGKASCENFLEYFRNQKGWDTRSHRGECDVRKIHDYLFSSIDGRKTFMASANEGFSVHISINDYAGSPTVKYLNGRTQVEILIFRTKDRVKSANCVADLPPDEQPCKRAKWSERSSF